MRPERLKFGGVKYFCCIPIDRTSTRRIQQADTLLGSPLTGSLFHLLKNQHLAIPVNLVALLISKDSTDHKKAEPD